MKTESVQIKWLECEGLVGDLQHWGYSPGEAIGLLLGTIGLVLGIQEEHEPTEQDWRDFWFTWQPLLATASRKGRALREKWNTAAQRMH